MIYKYITCILQTVSSTIAPSAIVCRPMLSPRSRRPPRCSVWCSSPLCSAGRHSSYWTSSLPLAPTARCPSMWSTPASGWDMSPPRSIRSYTQSSIEPFERLSFACSNATANGKWMKGQPKGAGGLIANAICFSHWVIYCVLRLTSPHCTLCSGLMCNVTYDWFSSICIWQWNQCDLLLLLSANVCAQRASAQTDKCTAISTVRGGEG